MFLYKGFFFFKKKKRKKVFKKISYQIILYKQIIFFKTLSNFTKYIFKNIFLIKLFSKNTKVGSKYLKSQSLDL